MWLRQAFFRWLIPAAFLLPLWLLIGWIVFGVMTLLTVLAIAGVIAAAVMSESSSTSTYPTY